MGNPHSKPEDRLRYISREVTSLRTSLRHSRQNLNRDRKEAIVQTLANQSGEVSALHGKVKQTKIDETLKDISETMEEILKIEPRDLDMAAVDSDSFVHMPISRKKTDSVSGSVKSLKSTKKPQSSTKIVNRSSVPSLRDIEAKINDLKPQINSAVANKDTKQLRVYEKTVRVLAGDLEMISVLSDTPLHDYKESLMKKLTSLFQKVSKALKELKRDDNLQYLSKQSRKDKALNDLADVELHLAENESMLDKMVKDKNASNFATIRNNVVQINQRLTKVDIVDSDIRERVVILSQKLTETVKVLDRTMAKREFDSKFVKASENFDRIVRNFNPVINADETKGNLENLRQSILNLEEINDTTKSRKKELLNNISKQLVGVDEAMAKEEDRKIIQKIVEDNVVLRKKVKSTDKEFTVIDQFCNYWNNVKNNFDVNSYSNLSLLRIDGVLEEMQTSINDIRKGIAGKCDTNYPFNLSRKLSQSVPRLHHSKISYGSSRSLDQLDSDKVIKARAKMYHLSTPELLNVKTQPDNYKNNRFSKIEEIKMQVYYIGEKMDESHNKNLLKEKLETYLKTLNEYTYDPNKTVSNNAAIVSNDIQELLHRLVIVELREKVDTFNKKVQSFSGTRYDKEFDDIKDGLLKLQLSVESFNIPSQYSKLQQEKDHILEEIFYNIESLQEKGSYYRKFENESVRQMKTKLQALNDKVRRFSGTYKGVHYNQIERDLNKLLLDVGEHVEDKICSDELTKDAERLLKILEQRSSMAQSFKVVKLEATKTEGKAGMNKIKHDLINIKNEIDRTSDGNVDAFVGLQSRLDLVNLELSQVSVKSNEHLEKEKEIFSNEAQTLKNVVDAKVALGQQPLVPWPEREMQSDVKSYPKNDVNKELEKFESKFQSIKDEVSAPNNEEDVHKYYKLAQDTKKLMEKLDQYRFIRGTDLYIRKTNLWDEMQYYVEALEKEVKDTDYMINIERKLDKIETLLDKHPQNDLQVMAKELQGIQDKLEKHKFSTANQSLRERKTSVQQKTDDLAQKLKQMENSEKDIRNRQLIDATRKLDDTEEKLKYIKPEVSSFVGVQSDRKFYELDEVIMRMIVVLDKFETDNADLQKRKLRLLKELHQMGQVLDERANQTQEIVALEQSLDQLSKMIQVFSGSEEELLKIKQKMEETRKKLQSVRVNNELVSRKNACVERNSVLFNKVLSLNVLAPTTKPNVNSSYGYVSHAYNFITETNTSSTKADDILSTIEKEVEQLKDKVDTSTDDSQFQEIDDTLTNYTIKLGNLNYAKDSVQYKRKIQLFETIEHLTDLIEKKSEGNEVMLNIEHELDKIGDSMNSPLSDDQINQLDERLIDLQISLKKMGHEELKHRIDACMLRIILFLKNISDYKNSIKSTSV